MAVRRLLTGVIFAVVAIFNLSETYAQQIPIWEIGLTAPGSLPEGLPCHKWQTASVSPGLQAGSSSPALVMDHSPIGENQAAATRADRVKADGRNRLEDGAPADQVRRVSVGFAIGINASADLVHRRRTSYNPGDPQSPFEHLREPFTATYDISGDRTVHFGFVAEISLARGFSLQGSTLIRPVIGIERDTLTFSSFTMTVFSNRLSTATIVQFPVLVKYRFRAGGQQWFLGAGPSFRLLDSYQDLASPYGVSVEAGIEKQLGPARLAPDLRYTRWGSHLQNFLRRDQVDVLLSVSF